jgi:integrase
MASISKRRWRTGGDARTGWVVSFVECGKQCRRQFSTKREADAERIRIEGAQSQGTHVSDGPTVREAAERFLNRFKVAVDHGAREKTTYNAYEQHVRLHISTRKIAPIKLARLSPADCAQFSEDLERELSGAMAHRVFGTLKSIIRFSRSHQWIKIDPTADIKVRTRRKKVVEIPTKDALRRLLRAAKTFDRQHRAEAFVSLLLFGGIRISELLALRRQDVDFGNCHVMVGQRADCWGRIGQVKTQASRRRVRLCRAAIDAIRAWSSNAPSSDQDLLFPNGIGKVEYYPNVRGRFFSPLMLAAGLAETERIGKGRNRKLTIKPKFGMHALRHAAVSLWIAQGANPLKVKKWAGHASVEFTLKTYGHLWEDNEGDGRIAEATAQSLAEVSTASRPRMSAPAKRTTASASAPG